VDTIQPEPVFLNFLGSQGSIPRNRVLVRNQFRCGIDSWRHRFHMKELKISELSSSYSMYWMLCVGEGPPILALYQKHQISQDALIERQHIPQLFFYIHPFSTQQKTTVADRKTFLCFWNV
jgi:hypothetical protein